MPRGSLGSRLVGGDERGVAVFDSHDRASGDHDLAGRQHQRQPELLAKEQRHFGEELDAARADVGGPAAAHLLHAHTPEGADAHRSLQVHPNVRPALDRFDALRPPDGKHTGLLHAQLRGAQPAKEDALDNQSTAAIERQVDALALLEPTQPGIGQPRREPELVGQDVCDKCRQP